MIDLVEIANMLKGTGNKKIEFPNKNNVDEDETENEVEIDDEDIDEELGSSWRPAKLDEYDLPEFNIEGPSNAKGAYTKWETKLSKIRKFIDNIKYIRYKSGCTIIPIATSSNKNIDIWGTNRSVANAIEYMTKIGLISLYDDYKHFGRYGGVCYTYCYYKENEDKFLKFCDDNNIKSYVIKQNLYNKVIKMKDIDGFDKSRVKISSKMRIRKPKGVGAQAFENFLLKCLYENYPSLSYYQSIVDEINEKLYVDKNEFAIRFKPHFTWSEGGKCVTSIGIRATNSLVSVSKENRKDVLVEYGFNKEKDVKSSVPRLTWSLNKKRWLDEANDLYEMIYKEYDPSGMFNDDIREAIKALHMRSYFENSGRSAAHHIMLKIDQDVKIKNDVQNVIEKLYKATRKVEGKTYGSYIFYVESAVYIKALKYIISVGYDAWLLYDCYYCKGVNWQSEKEFDELVSNAVRISFVDFLYRSRISGDMTLCKKKELSEVEDNLRSRVMNIDDKLKLFEIIMFLSIYAGKYKNMISDNSDMKNILNDFCGIVNKSGVKEFESIKENLFAILVNNFKEKCYMDLGNIIYIFMKSDVKKAVDFCNDLFIKEKEGKKCFK